MALDRITELFIMEAEEHLVTLEQGLVDLQATMQDPENLREMFRAAHSVKGSAAQLNLNSISATAHRLEDCFKILRDEPVGKIDKKTEDLFLKGVDTLKSLVDRLKSPFGLREDEGQKVVQTIMPVFAQLENRLNDLAKGKVPADTAPGAAVKAPVSPSPAVATQVMGILKQMLQVFKQPESPASRKQLAAGCDRLLQLAANVPPWQTLIKTAQAAVTNPKNSYKILAPLVIKELKDAGDLLQAGKATAIAPSKNLRLLAGAVPPTKTTPPTAPATAKQIVIPAEPQAAAKVLIQSFDKKQLSEIAKLLVQAIKSPA